MKKIHYILGTFALGLIIGGGGVYTVLQQTESADRAGAGTKISRLKVLTGEAPSEDVSYTNDQYGFSFHYPQGLIYEEFDEGGGAKTIVFQHPDNARVGFQIYITPYEGDTITGERILYDASGAVSELKEENIREDFLAATFMSEAPILGKTREIWWLHGGFLFELTTYAALDGWIRDIVKTMEFPAR